MSRNVIDSLKAWKSKLRQGGMVVTYAKKESSEIPPLSQTLREVERCARQTLFGPVQAVEVEKEWAPEITKSTLGPIARCRIVKFVGDVAECSVLLDGLELPNVGFPAWVLKQKGVAQGKRFHWIMRDGIRVRPADIDADVPQVDEMTDAERANVDRLYEEFRRGLAEDAGKWPEFTGPGR